MKKITCAFLKSIEPKRGRPTVCIPDGQVGGLMVRYGARGVVEFNIAYRIAGDPHQYRRQLGKWWDCDRFGPAPSEKWLSLDEARIAAMRLKDRATRGDFSLVIFNATAPLAGPAPKPSDAVEAVLDRYNREHLATLKTGREFDKLIRRSCAAFLERSIGDVSRPECRAIVDSHMTAGNPAMAIRVHRVLSAFLNWCVDKDLIPVSPMAKMKPPAEPQDRDRELSDAELAAVWNAVGTLTRARRDAIRFLVLTGLRRSEGAEITWSEISGDKTGGPAMLTIPGERMKNKKTHLVPLSPQARAIIDAQPRTGANVFDFDGKLADLSSYVAKLNKTMSIGQWQLHDLRRTMASGMQRLGVEPVVIDKCLAHSNVVKGVAAVYLRAQYLPERKAAMELWGEHVAKVVADNVVTLRTS